MKFITNYAKNSALTLVLGFAVVAGFTPDAITAAITVNDVSGTWGNVQGGQNLTGVGTNEIRWGGNDPIDEKSGYRFDGKQPFFYSVQIDTPFILGSFTHFNEPIPSGSSITGARLTTIVDLNINGTLLNDLTFNYDFLHNETTNALPCQAGSQSVCDDIVKIQNNVPLSSVFNIDGTQYTLTITGFLINGNFFSEFMTQEGKTNVANLQAVITTPPPILVPEPSTYLTLGSCLALCLLAQRRRMAKSA